MHGLGLLFLQALSSVAHQALLCHNSTHIVEFWTAAAPPPPRPMTCSSDIAGGTLPRGLSLPHGSALSLAHFHVNRFLLMIPPSERILHVIHTRIGHDLSGVCPSRGQNATSSGYEKERHRSCSRCSQDAGEENGSQALAATPIPAMRDYWPSYICTWGCCCSERWISHHNLRTYCESYKHVASLVASFDALLPSLTSRGTSPESNERVQ
ncbi:hypothetical protein V8C44DRAFT_222143 [Trichoderma aethiopicum]